MTVSERLAACETEWRTGGYYQRADVLVQIIADVDSIAQVLSGLTNGSHPGSPTEAMLRKTLARLAPPKEERT